jgi:hypothetical protein
VHASAALDTRTAARVSGIVPSSEPCDAPAVEPSLVHVEPAFGRGLLDTIGSELVALVRSSLPRAA